jgi:hypothetical protein
MGDLRISGANGSARAESDIRLYYPDPTRIIAASNDRGTFIQAQFYSADGGVTWHQTSLPLAPSDAYQTDPAVEWTSDGTAWAATIGIQDGKNTRVRCYKSTDNGASWVFDSTPSGSHTAADREIMWVDHSPASAYRDQIYMTWHTGVHVFVARRMAGSGGTWQPPIQISGTETTVAGIGGDIKTNSSGDVFVFWPDADGSRRILVAKSTNGGASFASPVCIATTFATTRRLSIPADSNRKARVYISAGAYRTGSKDLAYIVWTDLSGDAGCDSGGGPDLDAGSDCKTRIWFSRSIDGGTTWSSRIMLNDQPGRNDQFHSKLCLDESNGNLVVTYHDTIEDTARLETDLWMQTSTDDGLTWSLPVKLTSARTDETATGASNFQYGDYNGLTGNAGSFFPSWTDRRSGGTAKEEIWSVLVRFP